MTKKEIEKEFNLSEKIGITNLFPNNREILKVEDVKEFIKLLKEETGNWNMSNEFKGFIKISHVHLIIDKLAGDKLNGNNRR